MSTGAPNDGEKVRIADPQVDPLNSPTDPTIKTPHTPEVEAHPQKKFQIGGHNTTKSATQGAMNVALITANASQLKSVIDNGPGNEQYYYFFMITLLLSIILQVVVTFMLAYVGARESKLGPMQTKGSRKTKKIARHVTIMLFFISIINVIMNAFAANVTTSG